MLSGGGLSKGCSDLGEEKDGALSSGSKDILGGKQDYEENVVKCGIWWFHCIVGISTADCKLQHDAWVKKKKKKKQLGFAHLLSTCLSLKDNF